MGNYGYRTVYIYVCIMHMVVYGGERILLNNYSLVELILRFDLVMYLNFQGFVAASAGLGLALSHIKVITPNGSNLRRRS